MHWMAVNNSCHGALHNSYTAMTGLKNNNTVLVHSYTRAVVFLRRNRTKKMNAEDGSKQNKKIFSRGSKQLGDSALVVCSPNWHYVAYIWGNYAVRYCSWTPPWENYEQLRSRLIMFTCIRFLGRSAPNTNAVGVNKHNTALNIRPNRRG
jgi:hypothetical protein